MKGRRCRTLLRLVLVVSVLTGCHSVGIPFDSPSHTQTADETARSAYHAQQAAYFRLMAEQLRQRSLVYEGLFGPESDWVTGTNLLVRFYEDSAREQDHLSRLYQESATYPSHADEPAQSSAEARRST